MMMKETFKKEDFKKLKEVYKEFSETGVGSYIVHWIIGIIVMTVAAVIIYILTCFVTWSIPFPSSPLKHPEHVGIFVRIFILGYSFVVFVVTFGDNESDY